MTVGRPLVFLKHHGCVANNCTKRGPRGCSPHLCGWTPGCKPVGQPLQASCDKTRGGLSRHGADLKLAGEQPKNQRRKLFGFESRGTVVRKRLRFIHVPRVGPRACWWRKGCKKLDRAALCTPQRWIAVDETPHKELAQGTTDQEALTVPRETGRQEESEERKRRGSTSLDPLLSLRNSDQQSTGMAPTIPLTVITGLHRRWDPILGL